MKHGDLIKAAVDGKELQFSYKGHNHWQAFKAGYNQMTPQQYAVKCLVDYPDTYDYRIKPEPVPDRVNFTWMNKSTASAATPAQIQQWETMDKKKYGHLVAVKLTIKTDDNGVETEHVEIVK